MNGNWMNMLPLFLIIPFLCKNVWVIVSFNHNLLLIYEILWTAISPMQMWNAVLMCTLAGCHTEFLNYETIREKPFLFMLSQWVSFRRIAFLSIFCKYFILRYLTSIANQLTLEEKISKSRYTFRGVCLCLYILLVGKVLIRK